MEEIYLSFLKYYTTTSKSYPIKYKKTLNKLLLFWNNVNMDTNINEFFTIKELHSIISEYDNDNPLWNDYRQKAAEHRLQLMKYSVLKQ